MALCALTTARVRDKAVFSEQIQNLPETLPPSDAFFVRCFSEALDDNTALDADMFLSNQLVTTRPVLLLHCPRI